MRARWSVIPGRFISSPSARSASGATRALNFEAWFHTTQIAAWRRQALEHLIEVFDNGTPVLEDASIQLYASDNAAVKQEVGSCADVVLPRFRGHLG